MTSITKLPVLGDGGIETALEARLGQTLPDFAAYVLLDSAEGRDALREYYRPYLELVVERGLPMVLDSPTWRANPDWITRVDGSAASDERVAQINADAVALMRECAAQIAPDAAVTINGVVGPRFDEFDAATRMSAEEAEAYHSPQVWALANSGADRVSSVTTFDAAEGLGVVRAALAAAVPVVVSFTVGADGLLADGSTLAEAIRTVDLGSDGRALGFAVNCAHPHEVLRGVEEASPELSRIIGVRLNAAHEGDDGPGDEPAAFSAAVSELAKHLPKVSILGGCCGTDTPHIVAIADALQGTQQDSPRLVL